MGGWIGCRFPIHKHTIPSPDANASDPLHREGESHGQNVLLQLLDHMRACHVGFVRQMHTVSQSSRHNDDGAIHPVNALRVFAGRAIDNVFSAVSR